MKSRLAIISGCTGSGKTQIAKNLSKMPNIEFISADILQVSQIPSFFHLENLKFTKSENPHFSELILC